MKPVWQTKFGKPKGNCWAACIASILELPLASGLDEGLRFCGVPDFGGRGKNWDTETVEWLAGCGLGLLRLGIDLSKPAERVYWRKFRPYWIGSGPSPRGDFLHSTVYQGVTLAHDPHPDGDGLAIAKDPMGYPVEAAVIMPINMGDWVPISAAPKP